MERTPPPQGNTRQLPLLEKDPTSTPLKSTAGRSKYATEEINRDPRLVQVEIESRGKWFGPMLPREFLDTFLPKQTSTPKRPYFVKKKWADANERCHIEADMYKEFEPLLAPFCPEYKLEATQGKCDTISWSHQGALIAVDMSLYHRNNCPSEFGKLDMSKLEAFIEFKFNVNESGFEDNKKKPFEKGTIASEKTRGQLATYAGALMNTQFRTHAFCIEVAGGDARLIRIDREGAMVSSAFCWYEEDHLAEFFWRYNFAPSVYRGHDPSATTPGPNDYHASIARSMLKPADPATHLWKLDIHDEESGDTMTFYGILDTQGLSACPFGRCTRGFVAITKDRERVWFKETWRIFKDNMPKEGKVYAKLHKNGVPHIPHVVGHGDATLGDWQKSISATYPQLFEGVQKDELRPFCHYFIVFEEVGRRLVAFKTTWELVNAMKHALEAHMAAYERTRILHRDISSGNILISENGEEGFLIDWDFSKEINEAEAPRQPERTGTWQFMSAKLLLRLSNRHTRADDLESFFYVLCWVTLKLGPHDYPAKDVSGMISRWFDRVELFDNGTDRFVEGGSAKHDGVIARHMQNKVKIKEGPLRDLICAFEDLVAVRYQAGPSQEQIDEYNDLKQVYKDNPAKLERNSVYRYEMLRKDLEEWTWIHGRFFKAVEDRSKLQDGPVDRQVDDNEGHKYSVTVLGNGTGRKRTGDPFSEQPKSEKRAR
ncbi:hypothetical protein VNI00_014142 [Paramarasmius palmivorus]|uniref:Protein kinase domain-containing protein n=1 Tax=Paramarasmius palmivorus TaxID=297713 RepID=A0AAW0BUL7_9AGAR